MREMFAWTVYLTTLCCMFITAEFSLVLVYAMPGHNTVYPFLAGLMALAQVPYSVLMIGLVGLYRKHAAIADSAL